MAQSGPRSLAEVLKSGQGGLKDLAKQAEEYAGLAEALRRGLPGSSGDHVTMVTVEPDGTLVVSVESGAWASRLRYEEATLLRLCQAIRPDAKSVRVRVARQSAGQAGPG
jgi:hypothetical protein